MSGMFQSLYFSLLQVYYKQDNPMDAITVIIGLGVILAGVFLYQLIRRVMGTSSPGRGGSAAAPKKFNSFTLYRIASAYGLDREQAKLLEYVFRTNSAADPDRAMGNPVLLDRYFKRAYRVIEKNSESDEDAQQRLVKLFSLRNVIDAAPTTSSTTTGHIAVNAAAVLVADEESYPVRVISSQGQNVITEIPRNALGTPVRLSRGMRVSLSFFTRSSKGFSYEGQVAGLQETENGQGLLITHTGKVTPLVKRKFRRRQTSIRCAFFLVLLDNSGTGKNKVQKLRVDTKRYAGTVLDLSIGGCSIKTAVPVQVGARLKISIDYDDNSLITVLGQVLRINRSGPAGAIIHIKFLKVPRRAFNSINALVFGYNEE